MISFELFFEKCQVPVEVLSNYRNDPDVFISFTDSIRPRGAKKGTGHDEIDTYGNIKKVDTTINKQTSRIGLNPLTSFDTPAGVYTYPLKAYWDNIKDYNIPYVKDKPYVYVIKPKNPDRCARTSTYTMADFTRDSEELKQIFPKYHLEDIIAGDYSTIMDNYPNSKHKQQLFISSNYQNPPLRFFWSLTRALSYLILEDIEARKETKTKHITIWTHIMRRFYDGIIDDTGSSTIHPNEPVQAVFWTNAQFNVLDKIDRTCGGKNTPNDRNVDEWIGAEKTSKLLSNPKVFKVIKDAYSNGTGHKLNDSLLQILKSTGIHNIYSKLRRGDPDPFSTNFDNVFGGAIREYKELAIELYFINRTSDEEVFDDNILPASMSEKFIQDRAPELAFLLKKSSNSVQSARTLLRAMTTYHSFTYGKETEPLYVKLLNIYKTESFSSIYSTNAMLMIFSKNINLSKLVKTTKVLSILTKIFGDIPQNYYNTDDDDIANYLIKAVAVTKTKNPVIWRRFFKYFITQPDSCKGISDNLELFLNADTGLDDELKEYVNNALSANATNLYKNYMNEVWQKYYGVDLIRPSLSQFDSIKKSKKLQPAADAKKFKFDIGDHVMMDYNGIQYGTVTAINTDYGIIRYQVKWENDQMGTSTEREGELLSIDEEFPKFKNGDIVEDDDGFVYSVISTGPGDHIEAYDQDGDSINLNADDVILYDPKTSLHQSDFKVGDKVKIESPNSKHFTYKGKHAVVVTYNPVSPTQSHYKVMLDNGVMLWMDANEMKIVKDDEDALGGHGFDKATHEYSVGDEIIVDYNEKNKLTKFVITGISPFGEYMYDCYKGTEGDWNHEFNSSFDIDKFDEQMKQKSAKKVVKGKSPQPKFKIGDVFTTIMGTLKFVIEDMDKEYYTITRYRKENDVWYEKSQKKNLISEWDIDTKEDLDDGYFILSHENSLDNKVKSLKDLIDDDDAFSQKGGNYNIGQVFEQVSNNERLIITDIIGDKYHVEYFDKFGEFMSAHIYDIDLFDNLADMWATNKSHINLGVDEAYIKI